MGWLWKQLITLGTQTGKWARPIWDLTTEFSPLGLQRTQLNLLHVLPLSVPFLICCSKPAWISYCPIIGPHYLSDQILCLRRTVFILQIFTFQIIAVVGGKSALNCKWSLMLFQQAALSFLQDELKVVGGRPCKLGPMYIPGWGILEHKRPQPSRLCRRQVKFISLSFACCINTRVLSWKFKLLM